MTTIESSLAASKKLLAFYNANTAGAAVNKFADRKTAERRCALLAEELQAEKFTDQQIADAIAQGTKLEHVEDSDEPEYDPTLLTGFQARDAAMHAASNARIAAVVAESNPTPKAGSLRAQLQAQIDKQQPIAPRPKKADNASTTPRTAITHVRPTFAGTSRCQEGSNRAAVLKHINELNRVVSVADLDKHFGYATRGYLQKLLEKSHITVVSAQQDIEGAQ